MFGGEEGEAVTAAPLTATDATSRSVSMCFSSLEGVVASRK